MVELLQRTNQFNTTLRRHDATKLRELLESKDAFVYTLDARDRFSAYGLVAMCIVDRGDIDALVMSCRVLTLEPEVPFLVTVLNDIGHLPVHALVVEGPRNQPCRDVFARAGFRNLGDGRFVLERFSDLVAVDKSVYAIDLHPEDGEANALSDDSSAARVKVTSTYPDAPASSRGR
jgi:predicted enzyme involved in methoxymalonyl-ACP biosynthesis